MKLPSIRDPQSFYDVFTITMTAVVLMAVILYITDSPLVRIETIAGMGAVFLWDVWAILHILKQTRPYE